jgi:hypothetical protein
VTAAPVSVRTLGEQIWVALGGGQGEDFTAGPVNLYRGKVEAPPLDDDGTVHAYAVLYESPGRRSGSRLGSTRDRVDSTFQVTCVGGDTTRCLWAVDKITTALTGHRLEIPTRTRRPRIVEDEANAFRNIIEDVDVTPSRFFVPLLFNIRL